MADSERHGDGRIPKPRKPQKPREDGWTEHRRGQFIETLRGTMDVTAAARAVGLSSRSAYYVRRRDAGFARAWEEAMEDAQIELRFGLMKMALKGAEVRETVERRSRREIVRWTRVKRFMPINLMLKLAQAPQILAVPEGIRMAGYQSLKKIKAQIDAARLRIGMPLLQLPEGVMDDGPQS